MVLNSVSKHKTIELGRLVLGCRAWMHHARPNFSNTMLQLAQPQEIMA